MATVTVAQGVLQGAKYKTASGFEYYAFIGIPYAKPPIRELRFKGPQPPDNWEGIRDATASTNLNNNIPLQTSDIPIENLGVGSEDCLYLNVYTPTLHAPNQELLPVIVYIHPGGFILGNGILKDENEPDYLIDKNVIVVTFNYRLGIFGFLCLDIPEAAGNMGLKDQVKALHWVRHNVDKFGGDKNNVTLFGSSAGAASIDYHMLSSLSKGLFHKAIQQSGSCLNHWSINFEPKQLIVRVLEYLGYAGPIEDNRVVFEYLMRSSSDALIRACEEAMKEYSKHLFFGFVPCVEKDFQNKEAFLLENPYKLLVEGNFEHVPTIKGFCAKEGYLTNIARPKALQVLQQNNEFVNHFSYDLDDNDADKYNLKLFNAYFGNITNPVEKFRKAIDFFGDIDFVAGIIMSGKIMANEGVPVYIYRFSYQNKNKRFEKKFHIKTEGASHTDDLAFVIGNKSDERNDEKDSKLREIMTTIFANFAKSGLPTKIDYASPPFRLNWPKYTSNSLFYLNIDEDLTLKSNYEPVRMSIFEELYRKYGR